MRLLVERRGCRGHQQGMAVGVSDGWRGAELRLAEAALRQGRLPKNDSKGV